MVTNGKGTMDFFKKDFGFNGRETVAIMGAHSLGKYNPNKNGGFAYTWTSRGN